MKYLLFLIPFLLNAQNLLLFDDDAVADTLGEELVTNGGMELNSNWTSFGLEGGDVNERSTTQVHSGTYSRHVSVDAGSEGITSDAVTLVSGTQYYISFWLYRVDPPSLVWGISAYYGLWSITTNYEPTANTWVKCEKIATATSSGDELLLMWATNGLGGEFYIDDISIKPILE